MQFEGIRKFCIGLVSLINIILFAYFLNWTFFYTMVMQGLSMSPQIQDRDVVLLNRLYKKLLPLKQYDVIAFKIYEQDSIKRVIGLPGDTVKISSGNIYVNNEKVDKEYYTSLSSNIEQEVEVKEGEYYVLGDNLYSSKDSRYNDFGNVKTEQIIGKVWYVFK